MNAFTTNVLSALSIFECKVLPQLQKAAHLLHLLTILALTFIAEYAPKAGRALGKVAGRTYRLGYEMGRKYYPQVKQIAIALEYQVSKFIEVQLGTEYKVARAIIAPSVFLPTDITFEKQVAEAPRTQLFTYAKAFQLPNYNKMKTEDLRATLLLMA